MAMSGQRGVVKVLLSLVARRLKASARPKATPKWHQSESPLQTERSARRRVKAFSRADTGDRRLLCCELCGGMRLLFTPCVFFWVARGFFGCFFTSCTLGRAQAHAHAHAHAHCALVCEPRTTNRETRLRC